MKDDAYAEGICARHMAALNKLWKGRKGLIRHASVKPGAGVAATSGKLPSDAATSWRFNVGVPTASANLRLLPFIARFLQTLRPSESPSPVAESSRMTASGNARIPKPGAVNTNRRRNSP